MRLILGGVIISAGVYFKVWWSAVGLLLVLRTVVRWCPAYLAFGFSINHLTFNTSHNADTSLHVVNVSCCQDHSSLCYRWSNSMYRLRRYD